MFLHGQNNIRLYHIYSSSFVAAQEIVYVTYILFAAGVFVSIYKSWPLWNYRQ